MSQFRRLRFLVCVLPAEEKRRSAGAEVAGTHKNLLPCLVGGRLGRVDALGRGQRQGITLVDPRHLLEHGVEVLDTPPPPCTLQIWSGRAIFLLPPALSREPHTQGASFFFSGQWDKPEFVAGFCHVTKYRSFSPVSVTSENGHFLTKPGTGNRL